MKFSDELEEIIKLAHLQDPVGTQTLMYRMICGLSKDTVWSMALNGCNEYEIDETEVSVPNLDRIKIENLLSWLRSGGK